MATVFCLFCWQRERIQVPAVRRVAGDAYCRRHLAEDEMTEQDGEAVNLHIVHESPTATEDRSEEAQPLSGDGVAGRADTACGDVAGVPAAPMRRAVKNPASPWRQFRSVKGPEATLKERLEKANGGPLEEPPKEEEAKPMDGRKCQNPECGKPLPAGAHPRKRYCSQTCASRGWYLSKRPESANVAQPEKPKRSPGGAKPKKNGNGALPSELPMAPRDGIATICVPEASLDNWWATRPIEDKAEAFSAWLAGRGKPQEASA